MIHSKIYNRSILTEVLRGKKIQIGTEGISLIQGVNSSHFIGTTYIGM